MHIINAIDWVLPKFIGINYWKSDVHGFFTKDLPKGEKHYIKHYKFRLGNKIWERQSTPTYMIRVTWEKDNERVWSLQILLKEMKYKHEFDYKNKRLDIFYKGPDNVRNNLDQIIRTMEYQEPEDWDDCDCSYRDEKERKTYRFETETSVFKW